MAALTATSVMELSLIKRATGNPSYMWRNTYQIFLGVGVTTSNLSQMRDLITAFKDAEKALHTPNVEYVRGVLASADIEGPNYEPEAFMTEEFALDAGTRSIGSFDPQPRHITLLVKREVPTGFSGKLFYRGLLSEGDVQPTGALDLRLTSAAATTLQSLVTTMYTSMQNAIATRLPATAKLAVLTKQSGGFYARTVSALTVRGAAVNKPDHRYFDRA